MDKFEYKVRAEEIKSLIAQKEYVQAAEIADTIDWRRVKSVMMLCTVSDLYKINRRYEDARDMLLLAYDRHPGGRTIVYSLCELYIKTEEIVEAVEYYKEFIQIAPRDTGRYILQYKLYEAQDVSLEERIAVLEELKKRDYREKWAYELAYLYHRVGLATRCVEECDELILWFGDGKYVMKAMELKMLHEPLTLQQQQKYESRFQQHYEQPVQETEGSYEEPQQMNEDGYADQSPESYRFTPMEQNLEEAQQAEDDQDAAYGQQITEGMPQVEEDFDIHVKTMDVSQFNTINLQKELAEGLKEVLGESEVFPEEMPGESEVFPKEMPGEQEIFDDEMPDESQIFTEEIPDESEELPEEQPEQSENPEDDQIEGQMSLEDIIEEWNRLKREAAMGDEEVEEIQEETIQEADEPEELSEEPDEQMMFSEADEDVEELLEIEEEAEELSEMEEEAEELLEVEEEAEELSEVEEEAEELSEVEEETDEQAETEVELEELADIDDSEELPEVEEIEEIEEIEDQDTKEDGAAQDMVKESVAEQQEEPMNEHARKPESQKSDVATTGKHRVRNLTREERELFGIYIHSRSGRQKLIAALDKISLAAYTGNVIVTGDEGMDTLEMAKNIVRDVQMNDSNFSRKTAKISGIALNQKDVSEILEQLKNGALIIQKISDITDKTAEALYKKLQQESLGIVIVIEDTKKNMNKFLAKYKRLAECFNARVDMEAMSNEELVAFGKKYAREMEYSIDELGVLALHTRIEEMQTLDHAVTVMEVKDIMDEAIHHANRKSVNHFLDVLLAKRYDEEDMIILRENDFI